MMSNSLELETFKVWRGYINGGNVCRDECGSFRVVQVKPRHDSIYFIGKGFVLVEFVDVSGLDALNHGF